MEVVKTIDMSGINTLGALAAGAILLLVWSTAPLSVIAKRRLYRTDENGSAMIPAFPWLLAVAVALLAIALARPRWGNRIAPVLQSEGTIWLCVDVSRSMLVRDAFPNRLEQAKSRLAELVHSLNAWRVGLVAYAGDAEVLCPPTRDREHVATALGRLSIDSVSTGGSDTLAALELIASRVPPSARNHMVVLLLSDGGHSESNAREAVGLARRQGMTVCTVGLGDPEQARPIPLPGGEQLLEAGKTVLSALDEGPLRSLADATGGLYVPARTRKADLAAIFAQRLAPRLKLVAATDLQRVPAERYQWFLLPAFALALTTSFRPA